MLRKQHSGRGVVPPFQQRLGTAHEAPMGRSPYLDLSRRERQIMDALYRRGRASVSDVLEDIPDPPSYSAVRAMIGKLEEKGQLGHEEDGPRYVYFPIHPREEATETALRRMLRT